MSSRLPHRPRRLRRLVQPLQEFTRTEAAGGIVLLLAALIALGWANSPWADAYRSLIDLPLTLTLGEFALGGSLRFWVNDALMVSFFFLVGLEIKRELTVGELSTLRTALLRRRVAWWRPRSRSQCSPPPPAIEAAGRCRWRPTSRSRSGLRRCSARGCRWA
jgi:hypothetical protein